MRQPERVGVERRVMEFGFREIGHGLDPCYIRDMVNLLERAIAELEGLPEAAQESIGRELLAHVEKLRRLRSDIAAGVRSLDDGGGKEIDIETVTARARAQRAAG